LFYTLLLFPNSIYIRDDTSNGAKPETYMLILFWSLKIIICIYSDLLLNYI